MADTWTDPDPTTQQHPQHEHHEEQPEPLSRLQEPPVQADQNIELDAEESERQVQDHTHDLDEDAPIGEDEGPPGRGGANGPDVPPRTRLDIGTGPRVLIAAGMPPVDPSTSPAPGGHQAGGVGSNNSPRMSQELEADDGGQVPEAGAQNGNTSQPDPGDAQPSGGSRDQVAPAGALGVPTVSPGVLYMSVRGLAPRNPEHGRPIADAIFEVTAGDQTPGRPYITLTPPTGGAAWHVKGGDARQITWNPDTRTLNFVLNPRARASMANRTWGGGPTDGEHGPGAKPGGTLRRWRYASASQRTRLSEMSLQPRRPLDRCRPAQ